MKNRRRGSFSDFMDGFNQAYGMVGKVLSDREMRQISEAKQENMAPVDTVEFRPSANDGAPDPQAQDPSLSPSSDTGQPAPSEVSAAPMRGQAVQSLPAQTRFLGKTYDAPLNAAQEDKARLMAMSGVMSKFGDPMKAMQLRQQASQADQMERQGKLTDLQIEGAQRQADSAKKLTEADNEVANWFKVRQKTGEDGNPLPFSDDDYVLAGKQRVFSLASRGLYNEAGQAAKDSMEYATRKIQAETAERTSAVRDAVAQVARGDYASAMGVYNKYIPDGSTATGVKLGKDGSVTVQRVSAVDGSALPAQKFKNSDELISSIQALADPNAATNYLQRTFQHDIETRRLNMEGARIGIAQQEQKRAAERWNIEKGGLQAQADDTKAISQARKGLAEAIATGDQAQIDKAKQAAVAAGVKFEKPNNEFNYVPNPMGGGVIVNKDTGSAAMYGQDGKKTADIAAPGAAPKIMSDPRAIAIRDDKSLSVDQKRAKLKELGYQ